MNGELPILEGAIQVSAGIVLLALVLNVIRMTIGPKALDRVAALDTMYINAIGLIILFGMWQRSVDYFEAALLIAMMGFVGTVALAKYFLRGDIIE